MADISANERFNTQLVQDCVYGKVCSGCSYLGLSYGKQAEIKINQLKDLFRSANITLPEVVEFASAGASHLRDRLDFTLQDGRIGLYSKDDRKIVDIEVCAQLSPALQNWLNDFREIQWPFAKGSFRLRVNAEGRRGLWIDLANIDIKALLDEKSLLLKLQEMAFVEIGQRRKVPVWNGSEFKLKDPEHHVWFQSWMQDRAVPLFCQVASFTQPSLTANKLICDIIYSWISAFKSARVIEFGSGIGNLTMPALTAAQSVLACEIDDLSLQGLQFTLDHLPADLAHLKKRVTIFRGDFQKKLTQDFSQFDVILANPPRSGLMNFLNPLGDLEHEQRPRYFIYMSCFPESMAQDLERLQAYGYELTKTVVVDQFPQTAHYEVLGLLQRK